MKSYLLFHQFTIITDIIVKISCNQIDSIKMLRNHRNIKITKIILEKSNQLYWNIGSIWGYWWMMLCLTEKLGLRLFQFHASILKPRSSLHGQITIGWNKFEYTFFHIKAYPWSRYSWNINIKQWQRFEIMFSYTK